MGLMVSEVRSSRFVCVPEWAANQRINGSRFSFILTATVLHTFHCPLSLSLESRIFFADFEEFCGFMTFVRSR